MASAVSAQALDSGKACPCLSQLRAGDEGLSLPHRATRTLFTGLCYNCFIVQRGQQLNKTNAWPAPHQMIL